MITWFRLFEQLINYITTCLSVKKMFEIIFHLKEKCHHAKEADTYIPLQKL